MSSSNPTSAEEGKETLNSDPVPVSNDKSSAEKKKGKKRSRDQTQVATEAKGAVDSQSVDEPEATEGTSSSASTSKKWTKSAINHLQAENEKLKQALVEAKRIRKKDKPAYHEPSSEEEIDGGTLGLNDHDSDHDGFDNNVNPEDDKSTVGGGRSGREQRSPSTPSTGVLGVSNERMVNIHLNANRRGSLDNAAFTSDPAVYQ